MDSTLAAAAIGVGGTLVAALAGFWATVRNTKQTVGLAREGRVWERRADVYIEALAAIHNRQVYRRIRMKDADGQTRKRWRDVAERSRRPDWTELDASLQAFASRPVIAAMQVCLTAHEDAESAFDDLERWNSKAEGLKGAVAFDPPSIENQKGLDKALKVQGEARQTLEERLKAADDTDDALTELIRTELHAKTDR